MANTYVLIASSTLANNTTSTVNFSTIPTTYTDLLVKWSARSTAADPGIYISFNNTSQSTYSHTRLYGNGASVFSERSTGQTSAKIDLGGTNPSNATASTFSNGELYIPNYNSTSSKQMGAYTVTENNATTAYVNTSAQLYTSANAITSVQINNPSNFVSDSSFYLYGIKNS